MQMRLILLPAALFFGVMLFSLSAYPVPSVKKYGGNEFDCFLVYQAVGETGENQSGENQKSASEDRKQKLLLDIDFELIRVGLARAEPGPVILEAFQEFPDETLLRLEEFVDYQNFPLPSRFLAFQKLFDLVGQDKQHTHWQSRLLFRARTYLEEFLQETMEIWNGQLPWSSFSSAKHGESLGFAWLSLKGLADLDVESYGVELQKLLVFYGRLFKLESRLEEEQAYEVRDEIIFMFPRLGSYKLQAASLARTLKVLSVDIDYMELALAFVENHTFGPEDRISDPQPQSSLKRMAYYSESFLSQVLLNSSDLEYLMNSSRAVAIVRSLIDNELVLQILRRALVKDPQTSEKGSWDDSSIYDFITASFELGLRSGNRRELHKILQDKLLIQAYRSLVQRTVHEVQRLNSKPHKSKTIEPSRLNVFDLLLNQLIVLHGNPKLWKVFQAENEIRQMVVKISQTRPDTAFPGKLVEIARDLLKMNLHAIDLQNNP